MRITNLKPALVSVCSALLASLCCLLPLAVMVLGLGSGAFMALTMRYQVILLPLGILGVAAGYVLYLRERRRCRSLACAMAGSRLNLVVLLIATLVLVGELALVVFPGVASTLFTRAMVVAADRPERFAAQGSIIAVNDEKHTVTIAHGDITGLMSPMTMVFSVESPALLTGIVPGDRVRFHLLRTSTSLMVVDLAKDVSVGEAQLIFDVRGMT